MALGDFFSTGAGTGSGSSFLMPILDDPRLGDLFNRIRGATPSSLPSLSTLIGQGMNSPLLQQIIGPALARLMGTEQVSRDAVTDAARAAGSLRSTAYGQSFARNEQNLMQNRGNLISDIIAKTLGTLVPGQLQEQQNLFLEPKTLIDLLQASRPIEGRNTAFSGSGGFGGSGGSFLDRPWSLGDASGANPDNWYSPWYRGPASPSGPGLINPPGRPAPVPTPYYDPFAPTTGTPGGSGTWQNAPNSWISAPPAAPGSQLTYGPWTPVNQPYAPQSGLDQWGYTPDQWGSDPYYTPTIYGEY